MGKHLPVYTDHAGLQHPLKQPRLNLRQVRWLSMLADYDVNVLYKPGRLHQAAGALSRRPCPLAIQGAEQWEHFTTQPVICTTQDIPESAMNCAIPESFASPHSFVAVWKLLRTILRWQDPTTTYERGHTMSISLSMICTRLMRTLTP